MNGLQYPETEFARLLRAELKAIVAERAAMQPAPFVPSYPSAEPTWQRRATRLSLALVAVLAVAAAVLIAGVGGDGTPAAFAVESQPQGKVTVEIRSLEDPSGLEDALGEVGITASVSYLPVGKVCREPRFQPAPGAQNNHALITAPVDGNGPLTFSIDRDVTGPGQTLVITAWPRPGVLLGGGELEMAEGPVAPCVPVPAPGAGS
ncbi:MAG TPA: hypothetical protein VG518_02725 [Solirubrobacterales bacterium]|nr:hypothetical protein [Solirubrobacterales bacterium]